MDVTLQTATADDLPVIKSLAAYYVYDLSEYMKWPCSAAGGFDASGPIERFWAKDRKHAFVLRAGQELAGFALVRADHHDRDTGALAVDYSIAEFFVLRKFRGRGVGEQIARELFDRFRGSWEVEQLADNKPAVAFWHKVIDRYCEGRFEQASRDSQWGAKVVLLFSNHRPPDA